MITPVGIDLGTTFSAVAAIGSSGHPEVLRNADGQTTTPSVVLFDGSEALVGQQAKLQRVAYHDDVAQFVKRQMGDESWRFQPTSGEPLAAEGISALILKRLAADASVALGETVEKVVITVPAYFNDAQRKATKDAGAIAGLEVISVINEPTAAAVSFGCDQGFEGRVLIYDLGGGTFDVTLLEASGGEFKVIRTDGDRHLGGFDFDNAIIQWIKAEFASLTGIEIELERGEAELRERAEMAKHRLSQAESAPVLVSADDRNEKLELTREKFEELTASLLTRTREIVEDVVESSGFTFADIDKLLLVGGSTRMPSVATMLTQLTGLTPDQSVHPDEAVARGAAIVAAMRLREAGHTVPSAMPVTAKGDSVEISDVVSHGLGVVVLDEAGNKINSIVIPAQSPIPTQASNRYGTVVPHQEAWECKVTEGDEEELRWVRMLGSSLLQLQAHPQSGAPIEITYSCDIDGILHIEVTDLVDGRHLGEFEIDRFANLSQHDLDRLREAVENLEVQ